MRWFCNDFHNERLLGEKGHGRSAIRRPGNSLGPCWRRQWAKSINLSFFPPKFIYYFLLFRASPVARGSSQSRGQIRAAAACLHHSHRQADLSDVCDLQHSSCYARSLTCWVRPGIKPTSSWILVGFVTPWATTGTFGVSFLNDEKVLGLPSGDDCSTSWIY